MKQLQYNARKNANIDISLGYVPFFQDHSPMFSTGYIRTYHKAVTKNDSLKDFTATRNNRRELVNLGLTSHFLDKEKKQVSSLDKLLKKQHNGRYFNRHKTQQEESKSMQKIFTRACLMRAEKLRSFIRSNKDKEQKIRPLHDKLIAAQKAIQERQNTKSQKRPTESFKDLAIALRQKSIKKYKVRKYITLNKTVEIEKMASKAFQKVRDIQPWEVEEDTPHIVNFRIRE